MFPPAHPALAYLLYAGARRLSRAGPPTGAATVALAVGAVVPDLIDQPLARLVAVPSTRTLGHSLLLAVPASALAVAASRRRRLPEAAGLAFAVGYCSHVLADALWPAALGLHGELGFLLWPVTRSPDYQGVKPLVALGEGTVTTLWVELPLLAIGLALWWRDGRPGLDALRRATAR